MQIEPRLSADIADVDAVPETIRVEPSGTAAGKSPLRHPLTVLPLLILAGFVALLFDIPVSRFVFGQQRLRHLHGFLESMEPFGQPTAIVMTAFAIALNSARLRAAVPHLLVASLGAGLTADVCKLVLARTRPRNFDFVGGVLTTFQGFFRGIAGGSAQQGCPSAHTATAVGFAVALTVLFPRGKWLFFSAAGLVALQRIECGAHFPSDTCFGAAVGYAVAMLAFHPRLLGRRFEQLERPR